MLQVFIAEIHTTYVQCIVTEQNGYFRVFFFFVIWGGEVSFILFLCCLTFPS
jgi:hypothetical protein